ncbi:MAG: hypothetical protein Q8L37_01480 [Candidatus Gottesmanbacteria bacterium]|nr:hypothetical protein [Candidatus Gottesmanbacteria bacterium]
MPKKTKKEKIIAQYRRKLQQIHETALPIAERISQSQNAKQTTPSTPFVFQATTNVTHATPTQILPMDQAIRRGLVKTLILASMAIGAEVALSVFFRK